MSDSDSPTIKITGVEEHRDAVGQTLGRYRLLEQIGEGGCGVVYVAEQTEPVRRRVALKVIKLGMDTKAVVARFEAERQALAMMDHPNIAKFYDAGVTGAAVSEISNLKSQIHGGRPYFVMELVRGIRITDYCDQNRLSTKQRLDLFIKVCQAIQHAHQKGIIHRDIKPSNILVTLHDGVPVPKVIDFGIAKATEGRLTDATVYTQLHQFIGTPAYMSPEQAEMSGLDIDTRGDIYSLGVLLYEMLTGKTPFDAKELMDSGLDAMRKTIREKEPVRPSTRLTQELAACEAQQRAKVGKWESGKMRETASPTPESHSPTFPPAHFPSRPHRSAQELQRLIPALRGDLDWIVMKCLEKDRTRRYETANGLSADLKRYLNNEPVVARPQSAAYRFQKAFRRNKLAFTAAAAVVAALVVGIGISTWQTFTARRSQREAEAARQGEQQQRLAAQSAKKTAEAEQQRADAQARKATESEEQSRRFLYASDINLAQQSLQQNNLGKARRLLERHLPKQGAEDLRGWEWRYLWQLTRSGALVTLTNRSTRGFSVSFSPDGTRLAVGWFDGVVELWDVPGRQQIRVLTDRKNLPPGRVAFSRVRNLLAATSAPDGVTVYDLDTGRESVIWRAPDTRGWDVRDLVFSSDSSKLVIYAGANRARVGVDDEAWVVNVASSKIEAHVPGLFSEDNHFGAAQISPDNRRLYLARSDYQSYRYSIQCVDLENGQELWQTEKVRDQGLATLALSPDGRVLASGSGYEDPVIRIWDAATGRLLARLNGHTAWVDKLAFSRDGRRLASAASDQTIRLWDTSSWTETRVLRGHTDEIHAVGLSEAAQLVASASKDGDLMLWKEDGKSAGDGYRILPESLKNDQVIPLDHSRVLLLPQGEPCLVLDLKRNAPAARFAELGSSTNLVTWVGTNILCHWDGTNQIVVLELRGAEYVSRGTIQLESGQPPSGIAYNARRQMVAWNLGARSSSIYLASLAAPGRRIDLRNDIGGINGLFFSEDGNYLAGFSRTKEILRAWNVETGQMVVSVNEGLRDSVFAADGRVLIVGLARGNSHELLFYDLVHPDQAPQRVLGKHFASALTASLDGRLVASATGGGEVRLFDPSKGELIESVHGHLNAIFGLEFSPDGRRLISASGGREALKLWDVATRQELLTLSGIGSTLAAARWSADGDTILAGAPWQAWSAPSWDEIAASEAKEKQESKQP